MKTTYIKPNPSKKILYNLRSLYNISDELWPWYHDMNFNNSFHSYKNSFGLLS